MVCQGALADDWPFCIIYRYHDCNFVYIAYRNGPHQSHHSPKHKEWGNIPFAILPASHKRYEYAEYL